MISGPRLAVVIGFKCTTVLWTRLPNCCVWGSMALKIGQCGVNDVDQCCDEVYICRLGR